MDNHLRAKAFLSDEFFLDVVEKQRQMYISIILDGPDEDMDGRERARLKLKGLEEFIASINSIAHQEEIEKKRFRVF